MLSFSSTCGVPAHLGRDDRAGLGVFAADGDVEGVLGVREPDPGGLRGRVARIRLHLNEGGDVGLRAPGGLAQGAVDLDLALQPPGGDAGNVRSPVAIAADLSEREGTRNLPARSVRRARN